MSSKPVLYTYWRSSASWRVRIVLALKNVEYESKFVNLLKGEQTTDEYKALNPGGVIPTLEIDGKTIIQSPAIIELLEELYPETPLLPKDPYERAVVRGIVNTVTCDIHPVQNLRVLNYAGSERKAEWAKHFITLGFEALEKVLATTSGTYSYGDSVTLADVVLVPQAFNAVRWGVDMSRFPIISRISASLGELEAFKAAHPDNQQDAQL
ncbi:glutathione S-transferase [Polychytrium aggregatum]|uniref:glutathione S-transferase n=1 Tax=Polychytrium aggregatum TaxID=110093 RepID=UPI0022FE8C5C|nr:glutathione S-transferase [Polychytrium aggregatum]KAI9199623.1 glutathione S-transferase [Polychytrium aggregatum]